VTHNVKTFRFKSQNGAEIPFDYLPGQFLTLHIAPEGLPIKRSYTIASKRARARGPHPRMHAVRASVT
jgi:ferredoxin-NADP reductase